MSRRTWIDHCERYLAERSGRYEWRCARYRRAADCLAAGGLSHDDTLVDLGAGWTEFDYYLRQHLMCRGSGVACATQRVVIAVAAAADQKGPL